MINLIGVEMQTQLAQKKANGEDARKFLEKLEEYTKLFIDYLKGEGILLKNWENIIETGELGKYGFIPMRIGDKVYAVSKNLKKINNLLLTQGAIPEKKGEQIGINVGPLSGADYLNALKELEKEKGYKENMKKLLGCEDWKPYVQGLI